MLEDNVKMEEAQTLPEEEKEAVPAEEVPIAEKASGFVIKKGVEASESTSPLQPLDVEKVLEFYPELTFLTELQEMKGPARVHGERRAHDQEACLLGKENLGEHL